MRTFREADTLCKNGDTTSADRQAKIALDVLQKRYFLPLSSYSLPYSSLCCSTELVSSIYASALLMSVWDDGKVSKA